jgi:hypothetical protein
MADCSLSDFRDSESLPLFCPGRNEPLKKERLKWKSDYPMTDGQLRSKRDEFWDTAPAFEGRKEIWDALKAAAYAAEANDHELAQAILDGASITLPHGEQAFFQPSLGVVKNQWPATCQEFLTVLRDVVQCVCGYSLALWRTAGVAHVVELLPSNKQEALNSNHQRKKKIPPLTCSFKQPFLTMDYEGHTQKNMRQSPLA